jgi:regulatory protein
VALDGLPRHEADDHVGDHPTGGPPADPQSVARTICLRLLTARAHSRAELAAALQRRNVPPDVAETVLDRLTEVGLIDDAAFAKAWVGSRHSTRGLAGRALAGELRERGIAPEIISAAVDGMDPGTEEETARRLVRRRAASMRGLSDDVRLRRLVALLARKGYPPGLAVGVVREVLSGSDQ